MPFAVTHVLVPIIVMDLIRDHILKKPKLLPNKFIFLAGLAGLVPDVDLPLFYLLQYFGYDLGTHRELFHAVWIPLFFLGGYLLTLKQKNLSKAFLMVSIGYSFHLLLDGTLVGVIYPFVPFSDMTIGLQLLPLDPMLFAGIDAILLILWLYHEEFKHKISDYF